MRRVQYVLVAVALVAACRTWAADEGADDAKAIIQKAQAAYEAMQTYTSHGVGQMDMDMGGMKMSVKTMFTVAVKRPNAYLITWSQEGGPMPGRTQKGAVWSDGTQPYLYMGALNAYSKVQDDQTALGGATGISGGVAFTIPPLLLAAFKDGPSVFTRLIDPQLEGIEKIAGEDCYVISGSSSVSKKETLWISKTRHLVLKCSRSLEPPEGGVTVPEVSDEELDKSIRAMGEEPSEQSRQKMRGMMEMAKKLMTSGGMKGEMVETHEEIASPELAAADFHYDVPEGTVLKESLFSGVLSGPMGGMF